MLARERMTYSERESNTSNEIYFFGTGCMGGFFHVPFTTASPGM